MVSDHTGLASIEAEIREALTLRPEQPGLLAALGGVYLQSGDTAQAVLLLEQAARLAPDDPCILSDYAVALTDDGRLSEAESLLNMAMVLNGADENLRFNLARCLQLQQRWSDALAVLAGVTQVRDDVCKLRGDLYKELGDWRSATQAYMLALQLSPNNHDYLNDLGVLLELNGDFRQYLSLWQELAADPAAGGIVHYFLGNARRAEGDFEGARKSYARAVELEPGMAEAFNNLALVLGKLGQEDEAMAVLQRAAAINPDLAAPQTNIGVMMSRSSSTLGEAEAMFARAVALDPKCVDARVNYGAVLMRQRRFAEAKREFRSVLADQPGHASAELNLGMLLLSEGNFAAGWPYYESRWKMPQLAEKRPPLATPRWSGEPLDGKRLFVYSEQGFGDNLQFARYLLELKSRFPTVNIIYYTLHALTDLFRTSALGQGITLLPWGEPIPEHDFNSPLLSLPWRCATELNSIPAPIPYIRPDPVRVAAWRERLPSTGRPRVGLVWASSETFVYRSAKTVALRLLQPLVETASVNWVNLQFGKEAGEIAENGWEARFFNPMSEVRDFADTAAIVANLDLVISVDTAVAHLAGAMGKEVWMIDRFDTDWRWLAPREDCPWYPGMRIFRQQEMGAWEGVITRAGAALRDFSNNWQVN